MADTKITALTALTAADPANDVLPIVDVSDTTMAASGTTKKISVNNILGCSGTATLASATITGDLTVDTSTLKVDSANNRVGILTATPTDTLDVNGRVTALRYLSSSSNAALPSFAVSAGNGAYNSGTNEIGFSINSTSAMTLNSTGLGVGGAPLSGFRLNVNNGDFRVSDNQNEDGVELGWSAGAGSGFVQVYNRTTSAFKDLVLNNAATITASGNVGIGVTPAGTGGCLQLKSGITFPATQVASSDANTLDDYEEGTWTGTLKGSVSDPTVALTATGHYTKIGRLVNVRIGFNGSTVGASGNVSITGLPFSSSQETPGSLMAGNALTFTGSPVSYVTAGSTTIDLYQTISGGALATVTHNAGLSRTIWVSLTYIV